MTRVYVVSLALAAIIVDEPASAERPVRHYADSKIYHVRALPKAWLPPSVPKTVTDFHAFQVYRVPAQLSVTTFVAQFGLPHRYFVPDPEAVAAIEPARVLNILIYDLPHGRYVELDVQQPPRNKVMFGNILGPDGRIIRVLK
jgi:hypothetical protein